MFTPRQLETTIINYQETLNELFKQLSDPESNPTAIDKLVRLDQILMKQLHQFNEYKNFQTEIETVKAQLEEKTREQAQKVSQLFEKTVELSTVLFEAKQLLNMPFKTSSELDWKEMLDYGRKIARFTAAPPHWNPDKPSELVPVFPPIPQDMHIKRSLLFRPELPQDNLQNGKEEEKQEMEVDLLVQSLQTETLQTAPVPEEDLLDLDF